MSIFNLQWCEIVTVTHNYMQVTNMQFFKKDFLFKLRPHVIELQLKLLLNKILKVRYIVFFTIAECEKKNFTSLQMKNADQMTIVIIIFH